jgi:small-conductance mechanosensitive channel
VSEISLKQPFVRQILLAGGFGIVATIAFAFVCWLIVDAFMPMAQHTLLSANILRDRSVQTGLHHYFDMIDKCNLTTAMLYRIDVILAVTFVFAIVMMYQTWKWIIESRLSSLGSMSFAVLLALSAWTVASLLIFYGPSSNSQQSVACVADQQFLFNQSITPF